MVRCIGQWLGWRAGQQIGRVLVYVACFSGLEGEPMYWNVIDLSAGSSPLAPEDCPHTARTSARCPHSGPEVTAAQRPWHCALEGADRLNRGDHALPRGDPALPGEADAPIVKADDRVCEGRHADREGRRSVCEGRHADREGKRPTCEGRQADREGKRSSCDGRPVDREGRQPRRKGPFRHKKAVPPRTGHLNPGVCPRIPRAGSYLI